ncbi:MAG: hypothetical protein IGS03_04265 [Candidatus Sericytochromatia bacterium]|nr:hypothetical protein [Candidatus Sericytochromatia bacterium]
MQIQQIPALLAPPAAVLRPPTRPGSATELLPPELCFGNVDKLLLGRVAAGMAQPSLVKLLDSLSTENLNPAGLAQLGAGSLRAGLMSATFSGLYASIHRFSAVHKGQVSLQQVSTQVLTDTLGGFGAGAVAGLGVGVSTLALRSLGVGGLPLALGAAAVGAVSGLGATQYYHQSGWRERVAQTLADRIEKHPPEVQTGAQQLLPPAQALRRVS